MRRSSTMATPLVQRRTSAAPSSHYVPISTSQPSSPADANFPSLVQHLAVDLEPPAEFTSSPQLKFQQAEWGRRKGSDEAPLAWRSRNERAAPAGGSRRWGLCWVLLVVPLGALVLLLVYTPTGTRSTSTSSAQLASWLGSVRPSSFLSSLSSSSGGNSSLRSPHHTYAFAVPLPHGPDAYEEHPIHGLMREAQEKWDEKKRNEKKTCEEAMEEYKRRYGRNPPEGFQHWWFWAKSNKVQLLDEYDSINQHIEPFLALRPSELRRRLKVLEDSPNGEGRDHTLLHLKKGKVSTTGASWRPPVPEGFEYLLKDIMHMLPDMTVALYLHDASHTQVDALAMEGYRKAAKEGRFVNESELPIQGDTTWTWRERTCLPNSSLHRVVSGLENTVVPPGPSFVRNHPLEMSYCSNPHNLDLHGSTSGNVYLRALEPSFALSRTFPDADIVWPSTIQYDLNPKNESSFLEKRSKIVWRGSPDGIFVGSSQKWRQSQRFRLLTLTNSADTSPRLVRQTQTDRWGHEYQVDVSTSLEALNERYSDIRATGGPVQCEEHLCEHLKETMTFVPKSSLEEMADHRYVMDVDGNAYSARFRTHLLSNQVPLKSTIYQEWYSDKIQPFLHYVPIKLDYSDLYNVLAFFDGGLDEQRTGNHDALAEKIAIAGREWAEMHWRIVDMQAYVFRLLLEYARLFDPEREH
ncbi:hypothetical protein JCM8097_005487 [Rhodosporidiobolus ruineniae]